VSDLVKTIRQGFESIVQETLGPDWSELQYKYTIEKNPKNTRKRYGVVVQDGTPTDGAIGWVTVNRTFNLTLADEHVNVAGDENAQIVQDKLEDLHENIYVAAKGKKLGVPNQVLNVTISSIGEPFLDVDGTMFMTFGYTVTYRTQALGC
jgi:hypothetical protein